MWEGFGEVTENLPSIGSKEILANRGVPQGREVATSSQHISCQGLWQITSTEDMVWWYKEYFGALLNPTTMYTVQEG